jgi:chemotaxis response regulator CheB
MNKTPIRMVSVLLVCRPGLDQKSLSTAVNAIPRATVIAKAADVVSAMQIAQELNPDVLLADASFLQGSITDLLKRVEELCPEMLRVVLMVASSQKQRLLQEGADFVLDYDELNQLFTQIVGDVQVKYRDDERNL